MTDTTTATGATGSSAASAASGTEIKTSASQTGTQAAQTQQSSQTGGTGKTEAATQAATLAQGGGDPAKDGTKGKWSDTWREDLAKGDEKQLKRLQRFATPDDLKNSYLALEQKLSAGELKAPLAKDATAEQIAEWRKSNNIPETPDKYELKLTDGLVIGENAKPAVDAFKAYAHSQNWTPEQVSQGVEFVLKQNAVLAQQRQEQDTEFRGKSEDALRTEWGGDFKGNSARIHAFVDSLGDEAADYIFNARGPDGRLFSDSPVALKGLLKAALESGYYDAPMSGAGAGGESTSLEKEMSALEDKQRNGSYTSTDRKRYLELTDLKIQRDSRNSRRKAG